LENWFWMDDAREFEVGGGKEQWREQGSFSDPAFHSRSNFLILSLSLSQSSMTSSRNRSDTAFPFFPNPILLFLQVQSTECTVVLLI